MTEENPLLEDKHTQETDSTESREGAHKFLEGNFLWISLGVIGFLAFIVLGYVLFGESSGMKALSWLVPIVLLVSMAAALPKKYRHYGLLTVFALIVTLFLVKNEEGIGRFTSWAHSCFNFQDCSLRADELPTINNGTVTFNKIGETKRFIVRKAVTLENATHYSCLDIKPAPAAGYSVSSTKRGALNYLALNKGVEELVLLVTAVREDCP